MTDTPPFPLRDRIAAALTTACPRHSHCNLMGPAVWTAVKGDLEQRDAEIKELRALVAEYENGLNWHTTCLGCAKPLDSCYAETMRAEKAEGERDQLAYERQLLGAARRVLDLAAARMGLAWAGDETRQEQTRAEAADIAQRITDEIGHPATDEPALGPELRAEIARLTAELEAAEDLHARQLQDRDAEIAEAEKQIRDLNARLAAAGIEGR
jgi:chromosome segregation ATPase